MEDAGREILSLDDYPALPEVLEDGKTFLENALKKAKAVSECTEETALADDSGLEVESLGGRPGIFSARYAGENATDERNIRKLLEEMKDVPAALRGAAFRCALVLYCPGGTYKAFEGTLKGRIAFELRGNQGFGYDPVFYVPECGMTVAEMPPEVKNRISHRGQALEALKKYLQAY